MLFDRTYNFAIVILFIAVYRLTISLELINYLTLSIYCVILMILGFRAIISIIEILIKSKHQGINNNSLSRNNQVSNSLKRDHIYLHHVL